MYGIINESLKNVEFLSIIRGGKKVKEVHLFFGIVLILLFTLSACVVQPLKQEENTVETNVEHDKNHVHILFNTYLNGELSKFINAPRVLRWGP